MDGALHQDSKAVDSVVPQERDNAEESESDNACSGSEAEEDDGSGEAEGMPLPPQPSRLNAGQRIQGIRSDSGELVSGRVVSRAGKATGKFKDCYNFRWDSDGSVSWADLNSDFSTWRIVSEDTEMMILFNSEEVMCAKENEIQNWRDNMVYEVVEDVGQECLSVRWVVTEKVKGGRTFVKARLVARGFEEDTGT